MAGKISTGAAAPISDWNVVWGKLAAEFDIPSAPPNSMTVNQFAERYGLTRSSAERAIRLLVKQGKIFALDCIVEASGKKRRGVAYVPSES